jgi:hypothetical protein
MFSSVVLVTASLLPRPDFESITNVHNSFRTFKEWTGRAYASPEAEARAFSIFSQNDLTISEHNNKNSSYHLGHNQFSDLTPDEFKSMYMRFALLAFA